MSEVITRNEESVMSFFNGIDGMRKKIRSLFKDRKPSLNDERYFTDRELGKILKLSRRTLQEYRTNHVLPYIMFGGKVLYRESEVQNVLEKHHAGQNGI